MPRIPAFRRSALSVRFIFLAISGRGVRAFDCALSSLTSSLVHGVRWAEVFYFGTDCCSGKGSRLRATPVARLTHASKRGPRLGFSTGGRIFPQTLLHEGGLASPATDRVEDNNIDTGVR